MGNCSYMLLTASAVALTSTLLVLYLPPLLFHPPITTPSHDLLHLSQTIQLPTSAFGPESLAFDPSGFGPYTGVADGRILKWDRDSSSWVDFAFTSSSRKECTRAFAPELEHVCGRPLGLRFEQKSGDLYIADAYFGLLRVNTEGGSASKVVSEAEGLTLHFTNKMDIDEVNDCIYFTDSSSRYRRRQFMSSVLSGDRTGRLIKYTKSTKGVTVLLRDLAFANGVALSEDSSFVLVGETSKCRILRYWLKGPNATRVETFTDDLPGYPDNVRRNSKGEFWVALHAKKTRLADWILKHPRVGKSLLKLPLSARRLHGAFMGGDHGIVVKLSEEGQVVEVLEDSQGRQVRYASDAEENHGRLWIGSAMMQSVWVYNLHSALY